MKHAGSGTHQAMKKDIVLTNKKTGTENNASLVCEKVQNL